MSFLQAYDQHLNMILGDVEETVTTIEIDEETYEEIYKVRLFLMYSLLIITKCKVEYFIYLNLNLRR